MVTKTSQKNAVDVILVLESFLSETTQLRHNLDRLVKHFGKDVFASVIVIAIKARNMHLNRLSFVWKT